MSQRKRGISRDRLAKQILRREWIKGPDLDQSLRIGTHCFRIRRQLGSHSLGFELGKRLQFEPLAQACTNLRGEVDDGFLGARFRDGGDSLFFDSVFQAKVEANLASLFFSQVEIGAENDEVASQVLTNLDQCVGKHTLDIRKAKVDFRSRDCLVGYGAQLLAGCQFRRQRLRQSGRNPSRVWAAGEIFKT